MTDRELLELAAKAAGYEWPPRWPYPTRSSVPHDWNPLTDDGDALRLAVKLDMCLGIAPHRVALDKTSLALAPGGVEVDCKHSGDPLAATRRAIVRAAAAIGKGL